MLAGAEQWFAVIAAEKEGEAVQVLAELLGAVGGMADEGEQRGGQAIGVAGEPADDEPDIHRPRPQDRRHIQARPRGRRTDSAIDTTAVRSWARNRASTSRTVAVCPPTLLLSTRRGRIPVQRLEAHSLAQAHQGARCVRGGRCLRLPRRRSAWPPGSTGR
jgi:hypothetical protein